MARETAPCLDCGAEAPVEATTCPHCGYDVARHDRRRLLLGGLGTALSLSVVLAPVGLPLLWLARRERVAAEGSVTRRTTADPTEHLRGVLRRHVGLDRGRPPEDDGRRGGAPAGSLDVSHEPR